ncbi:MAG: DNA polymerase III subunit gamma/tau [Pseudomonadota bacterium]
MTYQVLARKWRPKTFDELVGQEHVVRALVNALDTDRVHHAFLFTGTRGVGKTTLARIFAKSLNCETGVSSTPCGACGACTEIDAGRFFDLIEVDAASRTKVDDTRELLENVQYAPTRGRYKVYLIDEVHMLSESSFNALLKTLEEPPPHVKFLLATTDPQKIPVTVLSRCLQFNLKRLTATQIEDYLKMLAEMESFEAEAEGLKMLATAADGSMRDGLSLLDQALAHGGGGVVAEEVRAMLGTVQGRQLAALMEALGQADGAAAWAAAADMTAHAPNFDRVLAEMAQLLHRAALLQLVPGAADDHATVQSLARSLTPEDIQLYYEIVLRGRRDLDLAPDAAVGFEMTLLRLLAFAPGEATGGGADDNQNKTGGAAAGAGGTAAASGGSAAAEAAPPEPAAAPATPVQDHEPVSPAVDSAAAKVVQAAPAAPPAEVLPEPSPRVEHAPAIEAPAPTPPPPAAARAEMPPAAAPAATAEEGPNPGPAESWEGMIASLGLRGSAGELARNSVLTRLGEGRYELTLDRQLEHLHTEQAETRIRDALGRFFGRDMKLSFVVGELKAETPAERQSQAADERQAHAQAAIEADPLVEDLRRQLGAEIVPGSVQPRDA